MLCSVVLPLYNKAATIGAALRSVLAQSHGPLEAIVVDDGSTDDGVQRVLDIADPRVRLIRQSNRGVSCARNAGIAAARGELVCFLDADDIWHPDFLACVTAMARAHPERCFFSTSYRLVFEGSLETALADVDTRALPPARDMHDFFRVWRRQALLCTDTVAIRRRALQAMKPWFPPGESLAEDQDLWFRLVEKHGLLHLPLPLAAYRRNLPSSLSTLELQRHASKGLLPTFARLEARMANPDLPPALRRDARRLVADKRVNVCRHQLARGERARALRTLLRGWYGPTLLRWWFSLGLCLLARPAWVAAWDRKRVSARLAMQVQGESA